LERRVKMWKVGDWCFCEFKLQLIRSMSGIHIQEVNDGYFSHSGNTLNDRCFPLDLRVKLISENFENTSKKIHELHCNSLNYPDIHRYLVDLWAKTCENRKNDKYIEKAYKELLDFYNTIVDSIDSQKKIIYSGVKLFGRG
jgi:hypothetical protein